MAIPQPSFVLPTTPSPKVIVVTNISPSTTEAEVRDFFSFCGEIQQFEITKEGDSQKATIDFTRESAARTAILLTNATLGERNISVAPYYDDLPPYTEQVETQETETLKQEHKPKLSIMVELLANGYLLSDKAIESAKNFDEQHGISKSFQSYLSTAQNKGSELNEAYKITETASEKAKAIDQKLHVQEKLSDVKKLATETDQKLHVSETIENVRKAADQAWASEPGQKLNGFIQGVWASALMIHQEAKRRATAKGAHFADPAGPSSSSSSSSPAPENPAAAAAAAAAAGDEKKMPQ